MSLAPVDTYMSAGPIWVRPRGDLKVALGGSVRTDRRPRAWHHHASEL